MSKLLLLVAAMSLATSAAEGQAQRQSEALTDLLRRGRTCSSQPQPMCRYRLGDGNFITGRSESGAFISVEGDIRGYAVTLIADCISVTRKQDDVKAYVSTSG